MFIQKENKNVFYGRTPYALILFNPNDKFN